ncbi:alpha-1,6-glucosidase domain-containing protein [Rheinheimera sp.]|uniref:alpha-1,6-glucosidase domain-containing protein n=1 Tax=Rheinheimera sp. TaxID=1869214 RepID=UPI00307D5FD1
MKNYKQSGYGSLLVAVSMLLSACGGSDDSTPSPLTPNCPTGQTYNSETKVCVATNRAPIMTSAATFSVSSDLAEGAIAYRGLALDADSDGISWALTDPQGIFTISPSAGVITVSSAEKLQAAVGSTYHMVLTLTDTRGAENQFSLKVTVVEANPVVQPTVKPSATQGIVYYYREDGNYSGWILHAWNNASCNAYAQFDDDKGTDWATGLAPSGTDPRYGMYWLFDTKAGASCANFIVHKGDEKDPDGNDQKLMLDGDRWAFIVSGIGLFTAPEDVVFEGPFRVENSAAHWIDQDTLVWNRTVASPYLVWSDTGSLDESFDSSNKVALTGTTLSNAQKALVPHLNGGDWKAYKLSVDDATKKQLLQQQLVVAELDTQEQPLHASYVQHAKALDALYTTGSNDADEAQLGLSYSADQIKLALWAPTAKAVQLKLYNANKTAHSDLAMTLDPATGIWTASLDKSLDRLYYRYAVTLYHPASKRIETIESTDPYSVNTSTNGRYSQLVNMLDADLKPAGWDGRTVPTIAAVEDAVLLEAHLRDLSVTDTTVTAANRGKYLALTEQNSAMAGYLKQMATAGVTHLHLLPLNDIATIEEDSSKRIDLNSTVAELCTVRSTASVCGTVADSLTLAAAFASFDPASTAAASLANDMRGLDGFNWGYDPHHFNVVEGSYASNAEGVSRIREFRQMVQSVQSMGLRVVLDVVYNHTSASGLNDNSVFDKVVPGYYHRYNEVSGVMERSTCCENTATEHKMMYKFVKESLVHWASAYGIDGFRFDIMGHMPKDLLLDARTAVASVDPDTYFYGEGWNFGEVASDRLFVQATQANLAGTEIGTFNDRPRDTIRAAALNQATVDLMNVDHIRLGLAGTLQNYVMEDKDGERRAGSRYSQSSYALDPADIINYVDKHDNETLWDKLQYGLPSDMSSADRVRVHNLNAAIPLLSQGIPFFQLGLDKLRSKSLDRNSYDSGDWFNQVDYSNQRNNWNVGLPMSQDNPDQARIAELLANSNIAVSPEQISAASQVFREFLQIRQQHKLLRLPTEADVINRVGFRNTGPSQVPGLIVMTLDDGTGQTDLDPAVDAMLVVLNGSAQPRTISVNGATGFSLHSIQQNSADAVVRQASVSGQDFSVPAYTVAVFVKTQQGAQGAGLPADPDKVVSPYGDALLVLDGLSSPAPQLSYNDKGQYTVAVTLQPGNYQFSISDLAAIRLGFSAVVQAADSLALSQGTGDSIALTIDTAGNYSVVLDITSPTPTLGVKLRNALVNCSLPTSGETPPFVVTGGGSLYVRGSHSGWNPEPAYKMDYKGENRYQAVADFNGEFQFKLASDDGSWTTQLWAQNPDGTMDTSALVVGTSYPVAYKDGGTANNRTDLPAGKYSFKLTLNSANPAKGDNVGSLLIEQCND